MVIFFGIYLYLILYGIKKKTSANFLSCEYTRALKGIGITTVFFNHIVNDYLTPNGIGHHPVYDEPFVFVESILTGLFVGMFLFFSGYGVFESYKKKGVEYVKKIPLKRIGITLLNFDIAVFFFLFVNLILSINMTCKNVFFSLIGWESIGNSNWYIFAIIMCYSFSYITFKITKKTWHFFIVIFFLITIYAIIMSIYKQSWWYNTIFCYPAGMFYSYYKKKLNELFRKRYYICIIFLIVLFVLFYLNASNPLMHNGASIVFSFLCVLGSMKVCFANKTAIWLGVRIFPLYIYQRLSMIVIQALYPELVSVTPPGAYLIFVLCCILITLVIGKFIPLVKLEQSQ